MNSYEAHFLAFGRQVVDNFADGFRHGAHGDDDALGIGSTVVVEQTIFATRDFADLLHVVLYDGRYFLIERIASLAVLEEVVGVLGHTAHNRIHGVHGAVAEFGQSLLVDKRSQVFIVQFLDFLDFVRGAEAVEEVDERHACLQRGKMCHTGQVHNLLYRACP